MPSADVRMQTVDHYFIGCILTAFGGYTTNKAPDWNFTHVHGAYFIPDMNLPWKAIIYLIRRHCFPIYGVWILDLFALVYEVFPDLTMQQYKDKMHDNYTSGELGEGPKFVYMKENWLNILKKVDDERAAFFFEMAASEADRDGVPNEGWLHKAVWDPRWLH